METGKECSGLQRLAATTVTAFLISISLGASEGDRLSRRPAARHGSGPFLTVDSSIVDLGEVLAGGKQSMMNALTVRVVSDRRWVVKLMPRSPFATVGALPTPVSRLQWRARHSGTFTRFPESGPSVLARGGPTPAGGALIAVDLQLLMETTDALGAFAMDIDLILEEE